MNPETAKYFHIFKKSLPMQIKLDEIFHTLGKVEGQVCLVAGLENGAMCHYLCEHGGKWSVVTGDEKTAGNIRQIVGEDVEALEKSGALPFKKKTFDVVVIVDFLERIVDDSAFVEECHKVLKPDGRLVVNASHAKPMSLIRLIRHMLGLTCEKRGMVSIGYTESQLFSLLKHGFDVHNVRSYSRFFVELVDTIVQNVELKIRAGVGDVDAKVKKLYSAASPFYHLALQLDGLLFMTRGHSLIAVAKRRAWRSRSAPVLIDGRTIIEAVLSKALE